MHVKRIDVNYIGEVSRIINLRRIKREAKMSYDIPFEIEYGGFIYVRVWIWLCLSRDDGVHGSDGVCVCGFDVYVYLYSSFFSRFTLSTTSSQTFHLACFTAGLPFSISPATEKEQNKNSLYRREKLDVNKFLYNRAALSP